MPRATTPAPTRYSAVCPPRARASSSTVRTTSSTSEAGYASSSTRSTGEAAPAPATAPSVVSQLTRATDPAVISPSNNRRRKAIRPPRTGCTSRPMAISGAKPRNPTSARDGKGTTSDRSVYQHQYVSPSAHERQAAEIRTQVARLRRSVQRPTCRPAPMQAASAATPWATSETGDATCAGSRVRAARQTSAAASVPATAARGGAVVSRAIVLPQSGNGTGRSRRGHRPKCRSAASPGRVSRVETGQALGRRGVAATMTGVTSADPFDTAAVRRRVLDAWAASPARFREDANAEEDLVRGGYRDRLLVELAQNAADAAARAGMPGWLRLELADDGAGGEVLRAANTGAPLDTPGVQGLATLRASAKRD